MKKYNLIKTWFIFTLVLSVVFSLLIPFSASAADEPTESDQTIIPAGTYEWNSNIVVPSFETSVNIPFTTPTLTVGDVTIGSWSYIILTHSTTDDLGGFAIVYRDGEIDFPSYSPSFGWSTGNVGTGGAFPADYGKIFTVLSNTNVDATFATWFNANTTYQGGGIDEPNPSQYSIEAGFYKARDNWTTAGFPVTDDSIDFRYYSPYKQTYIEAEGIAFLIENDIVSIWYMDDNVYADGWNNDAATNIEVTSDISVEPEFYTVFNNIFAPSSQGSNDFDAGYSTGYDDGFSAGLDAGYAQGYYDGMADSSGNFFTDILGGVLGALDSFTIFGGFSLLDLLTTLLGGMALIWILKLLAGG